jgi:hypothetical protein
MIIIIRSPPDLRRRVPYLGRRTSPVPFDGPDRTPPSPKPLFREGPSAAQQLPDPLTAPPWPASRLPRSLMIGGHGDALQDGSRCSRPPGRCRCQGSAASTSAKSWLKRRRMARSSTCGVGHRSSTPFATLNNFPGDLGAPRESATRRVGIKAPRWRQSYATNYRSALVAITPRTDIVRGALYGLCARQGKHDSELHAVGALCRNAPAPMGSENLRTFVSSTRPAPVREDTTLCCSAGQGGGSATLSSGRILKIQDQSNRA